MRRELTSVLRDDLRNGVGGGKRFNRKGTRVYLQGIHTIVQQRLINLVKQLYSP